MESSWFKDSELQKFIIYHSRLEPGDKLAGKVIEVRTDNRVLIDFGRFRALAEAPFALQAGDIIHVVVESRHPKLKLRLEAAPSHSFVSSQGHETVLQFHAVPEQQWRHVVVLLQKVLHGNHVAHTLFPAQLGIPQTLEDPTRTVKLKVFPPIPPEVESQPEKLSLLVQTPRLEKIRVDFLLFPREKKLNITYFVKSEDVKASMESFLPILRKSLENRFTHLVLNVFQSELSISRFEAEELEKQTGSLQVLDLNV